MPTLTIEVPEDVAAHFAALPKEEANAFADAVLREALDRDADDALISDLRAGIAEAEAGQLLTPEEVDARIHAAFAARRQEPEAATAAAVG